MEAIYEILARLGGEADLDTIVEEALKIGIPPPVATRLLMRLVEKGRARVICAPSIRYRAV
ncbi:hypothetical protein [Pyrobaculum neutrophilum]|uniref:Uncharacterized protein n=1 Tax=Pyrobaculum neutrophilum (strain DSM 2338 / JCM 9278 / NBRC 100436 / V24Sta) TaxID=444157 RepID=B1Y9E7_PYRNV|nr:hypothetical protein [Pyrobaculum neutrophilum]ACB40376.1 conserved hypothetical protein [Pyrobaculum neutrophilum V24Sta]